VDRPFFDPSEKQPDGERSPGPVGTLYDLAVGEDLLDRLRRDGPLGHLPAGM
jgi:hypothetical protein